MFLLEIIASELAGPPHDQITDHILPYLNQHVPLASLGIAGDNLSIHPPIQLKTHHQFRAKTPRKSIAIYASGDNPQSQRQQQQLNLSVLRFTFGIPGLDESYLPRWIGYGFGSLLILNHFLGSNSETTQAQLRTEVLGLSLAAFSAALPYLGRFLKGAAPVDQGTLPQDAEQIFAMSQNISDAQKEDLAWATYILLRNTNTIAVVLLDFPS
uniref:Uncharacterized protein n=1 Tax=Salix viminalis TaxID=40686 RepID=A0A6N2NHH7_SALVM